MSSAGVELRFYLLYVQAQFTCVSHILRVLVSAGVVLECIPIPLVRLLPSGYALEYIEYEYSSCRVIV